MVQSQPARRFIPDGSKYEWASIKYDPLYQAQFLFYHVISHNAQSQLDVIPIRLALLSPKERDCNLFHLREHTIVAVNQGFKLGGERRVMKLLSEELKSFGGNDGLFQWAGQREDANFL